MSGEFVITLFPIAFLVYAIVAFSIGAYKGVRI